MIYKITITFEDKENKYIEIIEKIGELLESYDIEDDIIIGFTEVEE